MSAARVPWLAPVAITSVTIGPGVTTSTMVMAMKVANSCQFMSGRDADRAVAIVDHHGRVEKLDGGRHAVFVLHPLLPVGGIDPLGIGARLPDIDATGPQ